MSSEKRKVKNNENRTAELGVGTQRVVIFDTNAYRQLCFGLDLNGCKAKIQQLLLSEKDNNTESLANLYTIMELATHLIDEKDPHYVHCLNALVALGIHTQMDNGIKMIADSESSVCRALFGKVHPDHKKAHDAMSSLTAYIRDYAPNISGPDVQNRLTSIRDIVEGMERFWIGNMKDVISQYDANGAKAWELGKGNKLIQKKLRTFFGSEQFLQKFVSVLIIYHANRVNIQLKKDALTEKTKYFIETFRTPLRLMIKIWEKIATVGGYTLEHPKEKRGNYIWDFSIAFAIGADHFIRNVEVFVVSNDKRIKEAAVEADCGNRVLKLDEYLALVGLVNKK